MDDRRVPRFPLGIAAVLAAAAAALTAAACGGDDDGEGAATTAEPPAATAPPATAPPAATERPPAPAARPLPGLPGYAAGFEDWDRLNRAPIPDNSPAAQRVGFDAHGGVKNVYVNRAPARLRGSGGAQRFPYPDGTILVKAASSGDFIDLVAVMRKTQGVDPEHGDWEFIEWKRSSAGGRFETSPSLTGATCWGCHASAVDTDWVFTTLER